MLLVVPHERADTVTWLDPERAQADREPFGLKSGLGRLEKVAGGGVADALAPAHLCFLGGLDAFLTMLQLERGDPASVLELYRSALRLRRDHPALGDGALRFRDEFGGDVVAFDRDPGFTCVVTMGPDPVRLPAGEVLLASTDLPGDGTLPTDSAVWLGN